MTVVEYTGGSTGSSLAFVCAVKGYPFKVVSSNAFSREKLQTMKAFGADLVIVHSDSGVTTPDLIPRMMEKAKQLADSDDCYYTNQIYKRDIIVGYSNIGREILRQFQGSPDACFDYATECHIASQIAEYRLNKFGELDSDRRK